MNFFCIVIKMPAEKSEREIFMKLFVRAVMFVKPNHSFLGRC